MYHPAELYSGRNTWDSYAAGGPNRGQWAPLDSRPWSHAQRSAAPSSKAFMHLLLYILASYLISVNMWDVFYGLLQTSPYCGKGFFFPFFHK